MRHSSIYADPILPHGYGMESIAIIAAVARARRHLISAYVLADREDGLEAGLFLRAIFETALLLGWLNEDPELASLIWMLDDQRSTLQYDDQMRRIERNRRRRGRAAGEQIPPLGGSQTLGSLNRSSRRRYTAAVDDLERRIRALPDLRRRLKRLKPNSSPANNKPIKITHINRMPGYDEQAKVAGHGDLYALTYSYDSRAVVHPSPLAMEHFLESRPDGIVVHSEPTGARPDPYAVGAALLAMVLISASEQLPDFDLRQEAEALVPRLAVIQAAQRARMP